MSLVSELLVLSSMILLSILSEYTKATVRIVTISGIISSNREIAAITFPMLLNVLCKIDEGLVN